MASHRPRHRVVDSISVFSDRCCQLGDDNSAQNAADLERALAVRGSAQGFPYGMRFGILLMRRRVENWKILGLQKEPACS